MMELKIAVQFSFLHLCFYLAYSLECQKCSGSTNSTCEMGTAETTLNCPEYDSCHEEYILNKGSSPYYRRGCAPWNWCATQDKNHGSALKYCRTCQRDKCNNKSFGSSPSKECLKCADSSNSTCQIGTIEDKFTCPTEKDSCYEEYIQNIGSAPYYRRGCAPWNWCATQDKNHGSALKYCRTCRGEKCNNKAILWAYSLRCQKCSDSTNSTCQMGTAETISTCEPKDDSCYEENIVKNGSPPLYRRGCAPWNWCKTQQRNQNDALKYCRTCQGDKCNSKAFGYPPSKECLNCGGSIDSTCQMGTIEDKVTCPTKFDSCYEEYIQNIGYSPFYLRGCASWNHCARQLNTRDFLEFCRTCRGDNCNNQAIKLPIPLDCIICRGSVNSTCQMGTAQNSSRCPIDKPACYEEYIQYPTRPPSYRKGCGLSNYCVINSQRTVHGDAARHCRSCKQNKCNNRFMKLATPLDCIACSGSVNSTCQMGTAQNSARCHPGLPVCYEAYIQHPGQPPLYRRACGRSDQCAFNAQPYSLGEASKYCRTCKEDNCNNQAIKLPIPLDCIACEGSVSSICQLGTSQNSSRCPPWLPVCYEEYIQFLRRAPLFRRDCGPSNRCTTQLKRHGGELKHCKTCEEDNCNNKAIESVTCLRCSEYKDGACRLGDIKERFQCPPDEQSCYVEYIENGNAPAYRRGCSSKDWCATQRGNHGERLKYCKICDTPNCNKDPIGAKDLSTMMCHKCRSTNSGACSAGDVTGMEIQTCEKRESCLLLYGVTGPTFRKSGVYLRKCGTSKFCKDHSHDAYLCELCNELFCNTSSLD